MKINRIVIIAVLVFVAASIGAQDLDVSIRYHDKQIYVPGDDIFIRFTIRNEQPSTYRFRVAENRMFNVDFDVRNLSNVPLEPAPNFTMERTSNQQLYYRDVVLEPGEEFSFTENLSHYVEIPDPGVFVVNARFHPDLVGRTDQTAAVSNSLSLTVRPDLTQTEELAAIVDDRTGELLSREALPPDEVVEYTVSALQDGAWNRYFLYVDLEGLLQSDARRARSYSRLSDEARQGRLEQFAEELQGALVDPDVSAVPTSFQTVRTTYDPDEATVLVDQVFQFPTYSETKRYTYFLRRRDLVWYIYDYAVTNLGTE